MNNQIHDLVLEIDRKDRRFKFFQATFMFLVLGSLFIVIVAQFQTLSAVSDQLKSDQITAAKNSSRSKSERDAINRKLDCIVLYFSQPDRTNLSIQNIEACTLSNGEKTEPVNETQSSPKPVGSQQPLTVPQKQTTTEAAQKPVPTPTAPPNPPSQATSPSIIDRLLNPVVTPITNLLGGN